MMLLPLIVLGLTARNCKAEEMRASVLIRPDARYMWPLMVHTRGILEMTQFEPDGPVFIQGKVVGLKRNSMHGFHIHEKGNLTDGCQSTGGHYNPDGKTHGANEDDERHAGDLGNIMSDYRGCAEINISDSHFTLSGPRSIVGRSIVVHAEEDDLGKGGHPLSKKNGNAGDRWACGIIGLA